MPTLRERIESAVKEALEAQTRPLFPRIYDGFKEADALAEGEDRLLEVLSNLIYRYFQDRNLRTITEAKAAEYEAELGIEPAGGIEARRAAIINAINRQFVLNDAKLHELCQALADGHDIEERTDAKKLTLGIFSADDAEGGESITLEVKAGIRPIIPLNLAVFAGVETALTKTVTANHGHVETIWGHIGLVSEVGPQPPAPPEPQRITIGVTDTVQAGASTISSGYWWMYYFNGGGTLSNLWYPQSYSSQLLADSQQEPPNGAEFEAVRFWDGTATMNFEDWGTELRLATYGGSPEFYTTRSENVTGALCGIVIKPGYAPTWITDTSFELPADLYTINGTSLTWNTSHPLFWLLNGETGVCS